jgi:adenosylcobinamide-GDP ribazoletransferase
VNPLRLLATALTFLTRLPLVARFAYPDQISIARSAWTWPWIGAALGLIAAQVFLYASLVFSPTIAAIAATLCTVLLTGAFHEDGLADSADGIYGGFDVERRLQIMKDSRIGSYGAIALVLVLALKIAALATIDQSKIIEALVIAYALARTSALPITKLLPYARGDGHNKPIGTEMSWAVVLTGLLGGLFWLWWYPDKFLTIVIVLACLWAGLVSLFWRKLRGFTGDALGALNQLTELAVLLIFAARVG